MPISAIFRKKNFIAANPHKSVNRWTFVLLFSAFIGFASGLIGLMMCAAAYFGAAENAKQINQIGTWLIVAAFPLVMLGAHALDKLKEIETKQR